MFSRDLTCFNTNEYCHIAREGKSRKLKGHFQSNKSPYDLELLPNRPNNSHGCTLKLIARKLSDTTLNRPCRQNEDAPVRKRKHHRKNSQSVKEKRMNGQARDDSILNGLQTVIDLCGLLEKIENTKHNKDNQNGSNLQYETLFRNAQQITVNDSLQSLDDSSKSVNSSKSGQNVETPAIHMTQVPYNQVFETYQTKVNKKTNKKKPSKKPDKKESEKKVKKKKTDEKLDEDQNKIHTGCPTEGPNKDVPCDDHCSAGMESSQRSSKLALRRRSHEDDIKEYWEKRNSGSQISVTRTTPKKGVSTLSLVKDMRCSDKDCCQDSSTPAPCVRVKTSKKEVCVQTKCRKVLSAKCFPPVEVSPCNLSCGKCYAIGEVDPELFAKFDDDCDCKHPPKSKSSTHVSRARVPAEFKKSRLGFPIPQPVIGFCNNCQCGGDDVQHVKYAMVKITEFQEYSIYELMQPYKETPKNIPLCIAEIFVVSSQPRRIFPMNASISRPCHPRNGHPSTRISFSDPNRPSRVAVEVCGQPATDKQSGALKQPSCLSNAQPSLQRLGSQSNATNKR